MCDGELRGPDGAIWIPGDDTSLQLRLCVIAHTDPAGHCGRLATERALRQKFFWTTLPDEIALLVQSCIHCVSTTGGEKVPRPFGPALHGTIPNDLFQFDYIELGDSETGDKYILMVREDHSGYSWLYPATTTNAKTAEIALLDWSPAFGAPTGLMLDGPAHLKNETIRL